MPARLRKDVPVQITWSVPHPRWPAGCWPTSPRTGAWTARAAAETLPPAGAIYFQMDEDDVRRILAHRLSMIGSDGLPHDAYPHPRLWGTFPRVLGHYARDLGLFSLETAVHKMTGRTAGVFGMADRGVIRAGRLCRPGAVRSGDGARHRRLSTRRPTVAEGSRRPGSTGSPPMCMGRARPQRAAGGW